MSTNVKRQPKGKSTGGQFAPDVNPESTLQLLEIDDLVAPDSGTKTNHWTHEKRALDGHSYVVSRFESEKGLVHYTLCDEVGGGGWRLEYDQKTRRVDAHGIRPRKETAMWRDRGEADVRAVVKTLEPDAVLLKLDRDTYRVDGPSYPLSESHVSGISSGEMMLTGGKTEAEVLAYVAKERREYDKLEQLRPDLVSSIDENRRYVEGMEIAVSMGAAAAEANTVGAMRERGL
jgi:hypothetical protein